MHKSKIIVTFAIKLQYALYKITMTRQSDTPKGLVELGIHSAMQPIVMGILNCTPDSFFTGSRKQSERDIAERAEEIMREGGSIIDIGAFSTRPGAQEVSEGEEMSRMRRALDIVRREHPEAIVSIDTYRPAVVRMAVEEYGANIINDVSEGGLAFVGSANNENCSKDGLATMALATEASEIFREVARLRVPYILMSVQKDIDTMAENFRTETQQLIGLGMKASDIILDPGYGFGKEVINGNFAVLQKQRRLTELFPEMPVLAGVSRKRMIWQVLGCTADDVAAMQGTMLVNLMALQQGATILRVHDVREACETIRLFNVSVN